MSLEALKQKLPNLHGRETAEEVKEAGIEENARASNDFDKSEAETKIRIIHHILSAKSENDLDELHEIIIENNGYSVKDFEVYFSIRRGQVTANIESFDNYLFHPHMVGKLMSGIPKPLTENQEKTLEDFMARYNGEGRKLTEKQLETLGDLLKKKNAKPKLTDGAKKELQTIFWNEVTCRSNNIQAKQIDKGLICEDKTIALYEEVIGGVFLKNKTRKKNEYFNGECDNRQGKIRDVKTSWEYNSFPVNDTEIPNKDYQWQLDAYMDLWEMKESELIYGLVDTPDKLIHDEIRRLDWKYDIMDQEGNIRKEQVDLVVELVGNHIFTNTGLYKFCQSDLGPEIKLEWFAGKFIEIPKEERLKIFSLEYCPKRNKQLKQMLDLARKYLNELLKSYKG